jgi:5-bromo-4-chloroindolyl phosphate hydrolysis protein
MKKIFAIQNKIKKLSLDRDEWVLVDDAASDVASKYLKITKQKPKDFIDPHGQFFQDAIDKGLPLVNNYLQKHHQEVAENRTLHDEFLYKLDEELMSRYADDPGTIYDIDSEESIW